MPIVTCHGMRPRDILQTPQVCPAPVLAWLGQAGVLVRCSAGMLVCHFGMFDFNTVSEAWLDEQIAGLTGPPQCVRPDITTVYELHASRGAAAGAFRAQPQATTT